MKFSGMRALAAVFLFATLTAARAEAPDPAAAPIQSFYAVLLDTMKHAKELGVRGRFERLKPAVEETFDIPDMVRIAVGPDKWALATPAEQQELQAAFLRYTAASYASNFDGYSGEKFIVDPNVQPHGLDKMVLSKLVTAKESIVFNYRMRQVGGAWRILDVILTGTISQLASQRSEYAATLSAGGAPALIKKINALTGKLLAG